MSFGLTNETVGKINSVFVNFPELEKVMVYGSRAKGNFREGSDIDLSLVGNNLTEKILAKIISDIEDLNLPYLFDISIFHMLNSPDLVDHIIRVGKVFYKK